MENVDVMVAFLDEKQRLRRAEAGTVQYFRECAGKAGIKAENIHGPIELKAQFRCAGNYQFVLNLDGVLYEHTTEPIVHTKFECSVTDNIEDLECKLMDRINAGYTARLVAGFCWLWSDPLPDDTLPSDVTIGSWKRPWNRKATRSSYRPEEHPYTLWARRQTEQLSEIGCIYSVQGFEFDYVGVIWGPDLVWRDTSWMADPGKSFDSEMKLRRRPLPAKEAISLLANAYRVLCSRALRGCFIYCVDDETRHHLSRVLGGDVTAKSASLP